MNEVHVPDSVVDQYNQLRFGGGKVRFIVYKLNTELTEVAVEHTGGNEKSWEDMAALMPQHECRYAVFHLDYEKEGAPRTKEVFITWCPESADVKHKMTYTASKKSLKIKLEGIGCDLNATDASEMAKDEVLSKLSRLG